MNQFPRALVRVGRAVFGRLTLGLLLVTAGASPALADAPAPLQITTTTLPALAVGTAINVPLTATGGAGGYAWSTPLAALPPGLVLDASTGLLHGAPTKTGNYVVFPRVTDASGATTQRGWNVNVASAPANTSGGGTTTTPPSNPPPSTPNAYLVTVTSGTANGVASGNFTVGATVTLTAATAPAGQLFKQWTGNAPFANSAASTTTFTMPASTISVAATYTTPAPTTYPVTVTNGTANGVASGNFTVGATVTLTAAAAPAGQYFKQWVGNAPVANSFGTTTTFTMPASVINVTASYYVPAPIPATVSGHPRLWLRPTDVARYQTWATQNNTIYQNLRNVLAQANSVYFRCFPNGGTTPASPYPDKGDIYGYAGANTSQDVNSEEWALVFAFFALIDTDANARQLYAQRAHDLFMYQMNQAVAGHAAGVPFRDPIFAIYNRSNGNGEAWPLIYDWLQGVVDAQGQPVTVFNASDKLTIRTVFLMWANDCLNASTSGGDHPSPVGLLNNSGILLGGNAHRQANNNYYLNHARLITMMPLAFDPADDPAIVSTIPDAVLGNTLRSYLADATGAWLYDQYGMMGDPAAVRAADGLPATAKVGLASGGIPPEGGLYGHSYGFALGQMLALQTAGYNDPAIAGPQGALISGPVWDRFAVGFMSTWVPQQKVDPHQTYLGPVYQMSSFGDLLRLWITPDFMVPYALLALREQQQGQTTHLNAARWVALNGVEGGTAGLTTRMTRPWSTTEPILYFMLFDPTAPAPTDPRPAYSTSFFDAGIGRLLARTDWTPGASFFAFRSGWESINHQNCDAGVFELYRKGEWLTKELSNYDDYGNGQSSIWHNTLALQNWSAGTPNLQYFEKPYLTYGSQWNNGMSQGDPVTLGSSGSGYAYASTDMTKLYNRPDNYTPANGLLDIQHASRSVLWLGDTTVVYDRATSAHNGFKRFNLSLAAAPTVIDLAAHTATGVTSAGQRIYVQNLLPANSTTSITWVPEGGTLTNIAGMESMTGRIVIQDTNNPLDERFLHVVQGADAPAGNQPAGAMTPATVLHSDSNAATAYDGAIVGSAVALFPVSIATPSTGTTYHVAATVTKHYVAGLTPGAGYTVSASSDGTTAQVTVTAGGALSADAAGLLVFDLASVLP